MHYKLYSWPLLLCNVGNPQKPFLVSNFPPNVPFVFYLFSNYSVLITYAFLSIAYGTLSIIMHIGNISNICQLFSEK